MFRKKIIIDGVQVSPEDEDHKEAFDKEAYVGAAYKAAVFFAKLILEMPKEAADILEACTGPPEANYDKHPLPVVLHRNHPGWGGQLPMFNPREKQAALLQRDRHWMC